MKRLSLLICTASPGLRRTGRHACRAGRDPAFGRDHPDPGQGQRGLPKATDSVKVHYRGTLPDGTEFDSSYKRGQPISFPLNRVIPCWTEGVQKMQVGGKAKLVCPPATAYGARGVPGTIPPNATLNFEVELLGIGG